MKGVTVIHGENLRPVGEDAGVFYASWPGLSQPSTSLANKRRKTWMPGSPARRRAEPVIGPRFARTRWRLSPGITGSGKSTTPQRRHHDLLAAAGAAVGFLAGAELQILAHADTDLGEPGPVAGHGDRGIAQARIDLDEGVLDLGGRHGLGLRQFQIFGRNLHRRARLADGLE